jgi:glycerate 2-kinase
MVDMANRKTKTNLRPKRWIIARQGCIFAKNRLPMPRLLICPDSFKESLSAAEVANALSVGFARALPQAEIVRLPMADGGEGTDEAMVAATGGRLVPVQAHDPLMRPHEAFLGLLGHVGDSPPTAVVSLAAASGLALLAENERNPLLTTTFGTGQLVRKALDLGCRRIIVGLGGSATNDGGAGLLQALGASLTDASGREIPPGGGNLHRLARIDLSGLDQRLANTEVLVACDVTNPLVGPLGASAVYGPQKGATPRMVAELDANLGHFAQIIGQDLGKHIAQWPGVGAAGGTGGGLVAVLNAKLRPGFELVAEAVGLPGYLAGADLVVTGEGRIDGQTQFGKVPYGVAQLAKPLGKPVIAFVGAVGAGIEELHGYGLTSIFSIADRPMLLDEALVRAPELLAHAAAQVGRLLAVQWGR